MFCSVGFRTLARTSVLVSVVYHHAACAGNLVSSPSAEKGSCWFSSKQLEEKNVVLSI